MFAVVDTETTGISPHVDRIIEIAVCVADEAGQVVSEFETLVRPDGDVPAAARPRMSALADAPTFAEVLGDLAAIVGPHMFVAHNAMFDLRMLAAEMRRIGAPLGTLEYLCTRDLAITLGVDVPNRTLAGLCAHFGIDQPVWHAAMPDARATCGVLRELLELSRSYGRAGEEWTGVWSAGYSDAGEAVGWPTVQRTGRSLARDLETFPPVSPQASPARASKPSWRRSGSSSGSSAMSIVIEFSAYDEAAAVVDGLLELVESGTVDKLDEDTVVELRQILESPDRALLREELVEAYAEIVEQQRAEPEPDDRSLAERWSWGEAFERMDGIKAFPEIIRELAAAGDDELWRAEYEFVELLIKHGGRRDEIQELWPTILMHAPADELEYLFGCWWEFLEKHRDVEGMADAFQCGLSQSGAEMHQLAIDMMLLTSQRYQHEHLVVARLLDSCEQAVVSLADRAFLDRVRAAKVRFLEGQDDMAGAFRLCEQEWSRGSRDLALADRYSLMLERAKRFEDAALVAALSLKTKHIEFVLDSGCAATLERRRDRCAKKAAGA